VTGLIRARWLALLIPAALMAGALGSQLIGGLVPCEMCHWQRWPHYTAIALSLLAFAVPARAAKTLLIALAALAILTSGVIGVFHAGVEYGYWPGPTHCASLVSGGGDILKNIMATSMVSCDQPQWTFHGVSLAGFNAIISLAGGLMVLLTLGKRT
jgi:disulfide bond formation protein DsbB